MALLDAFIRPWRFWPKQDIPPALRLFGAVFSFLIFLLLLFIVLANAIPWLAGLVKH